MKRLALVILGIIVAAAAGYVGYRYGSAPRTAPLAASHKSPDCLHSHVVLHDAEGQPQTLAAWRGHLLLVNFWASWCAPCRHEMPDLQATAKRFAAKGLSVVGVAVDDPAPAQRFAREVGVSYPLLYGHKAADELLAACSAGLQGLPLSVVIGRDGKVCARHAGGLDQAGFAGLLASCAGK